MKRLAALPLALLAAGAIHCGSGESPEGEITVAPGGDAARSAPVQPGTGFMAPLHRFVDPGAGPPGFVGAAILDETRLVLAAPPHGFVVEAESVTAGTGGRVRLAPSLTGPFNEAGRLVVIPRVKAKDGWTALPPQILETEAAGEGRILPLEFEIPDGKAGEIAKVSLEAYGVDSAGLAALESSEVRIPEGAVLEFALGILEPAWDQGPVEFRLLSCEGDECDELFKETIDPSGESHRGWQERRIALDGPAGRMRSFRFEAGPLRGDAEFSLPVWANPTIFAPAERGENDVNVILLSIDTLRADHLTSYGYRHDTAPFIDTRFARGGTLFSNCVASATTTSPSHMSMFTSLQPSTHGLKTGFEMLPRTIVTMTELIRARSIETGAFTEDGWLGIQHGFGRGFNVYSENKSANIMVPLGQVDLTFSKAARWLELNHNKRFFLFLHTFQVHAPYWPPERYRGMFSDFEGKTIDQNSPVYLRDMANYDREIRYTDDELQSLFETIDALGLAENTIFILTSDHGEAFLEHGLISHGAQMYEEAVHVPLMFWGRGIAAGERIDPPVSHLDFMPTILDFFGIPAPEQTRGRSLLPLLEAGAKPADFTGRTLFSESWGLAMKENNRIVPFSPPAFGVRKDATKLARYRAGQGYRYELFDLSSDPLEKNNLYPEKAGDVGDLRDLIDGYEKDCADRRAAIDAAAEKGARQAPPEKIHLDPDREEKLRALGYIE